MTPMILLSSLLCFFTVLLAGLWLGPMWDDLSRRYVGDLIGKLEALGVESERIDLYMRWWGIAMFTVPFLFAVVLRMLPIALGAAYLAFIAPRYLLLWRIAERRQLLSDQMAKASVALANSARAGLSQAQGMELVARESPEPLAAEFRRIVSNYNAGRPLADSLEDARKRLDLEAFTIFSSVLMVCMERGGNVSFALDRISGNLVELQRLRRKLDTDTAGGRRTALLLGLFPLVFLGGFTALDRAMMSYMYTTWTGQWTLLAVGFLVYVSVKWCIKIMAIDF